ncbi:MAG TPA: DUF58 domain-containing protein [Fimbriiglobus sp.]|jgi:uncharacterized protein (DUF58 family)
MRWFVGIFLLIGLALALQAGLVAFAGYVLLGVFLLSRYLARNWIASLAAEREVNTEPREVGEETDVLVRVKNEGKLVIPWVLAEDLLPNRALRKPSPAVTIKGSRLRVLFLRSGSTKLVKYKITYTRRGYYAIGPVAVETGDVFGLHRRHRVLTEARFVMVYPRMLPITRYDFASERPIGEIRLANRLFEDPTRTAGVRPYVAGDPLQRIHWRATARTGLLHCRVYEPTSLAGASLLIDFHSEGYPARGEPYRSELAVTTAVSLAYAVCGLNQQIGIASNGRDAADRIREESLQTEEALKEEEYHTRLEAREHFEMKEKNDRLRPVVVDTRRGFDQFQQIRETLARLELTDGMGFERLVIEMLPRLPRDATVIAILPRVTVEMSLALGHLRRQGFAVSALLIGMADDGSDTRAVAHGRLIAEGVRDIRYVNTDNDVMALGDRAAVAMPADYQFQTQLA